MTKEEFKEMFKECFDLSAWVHDGWDGKRVKIQMVDNNTQEVVLSTSVFLSELKED